MNAAHFMVGLGAGIGLAAVVILAALVFLAYRTVRRLWRRWRRQVRHGASFHPTPAPPPRPPMSTEDICREVAMRDIIRTRGKVP